MITAKALSDKLGYPTILSIAGSVVTVDDAEHPATLNEEGEIVVPPQSRVEPWHQTYVQACWDAQAILPYDEAKAEQLYNWQQADVPLSVSKPKFFVALYRSHQKTLADIKTAIDNAITDIDANYEAHVELDTCAEIQRDNPLVEAIGKNVWELTDEQIDNVFKLAKSLAS